MLELYYFENSICAERPLMTLAEKGVTDWVPFAAVGPVS